ncbi:DNA mismatch repair protein MutS [Minicystis rosea]|nr:DNA mismatch repair protein MutS [Minicystis rosea]
MPTPTRDAGPIPDLLSPEPTIRVDLAELRQTIVFAFATSGEIDQFERALAGAALPASAWDAEQFERDLFLHDLVERGFPVRAAGRVYQPSVAHLLRVLSQPPRDGAVVPFRRAILEELVEVPDLRADLERIYIEIVALRGLLCAGRQPSRWLRRLEILRAVHALFASLANRFTGATSGLARLRAFGAHVIAGEAYKRLDALLDHEANLGTVDLRVGVGSDGELRTFQIVAVRENTANPFHASPLGRWIAKISLFLRGFRMNGGEVVERLVDDVFSGLEESVAMLFQLVGDIELHLAALGFRDRAMAKGLAVCFPDLVANGEAGMRFIGLFNPLLIGDKSVPVPCDLRIARAGSVVIVTGPNSGGKTRLLQAIALAQMLAEAGCFVPAAAATLPRVSGLFVSLVQESRADQPEGQLGMELLRIRRVFETLDMGSLVLLDELCSGTNPSEGEEIARLVISLLPELSAQVFVTTHLLSFAERLAQDRPIEALEVFQVELDAHERPTYGFVPGVAKTSLAHKTAARLGVTKDELLGLIAAKKRAAASEGSGPTSGTHARAKVESAAAGRR